MKLVLVHRAPGASHGGEHVPVWRTCLREVLFFPDAESAAAAGTPIVEGEAYRLLLEVVCGLRSPMLGETQVMGQFKRFLATLGPEYTELTKTGQRLLCEARIISERHLRSLGSRSYGSATRRRLADGQHAAVIGTGALAREFLDVLPDGTRFVDQWGRRPAAEVPRRSRVTYRILSEAASYELSTAPVALVVAAPVPSLIVDDVARRYPALCRVIDLRAEPGFDPLDVAAPVVSLGELFAEIEAARHASVRHVEAALASVDRMSREYELRAELYPFGWEDVCA
jgi:glutamyl-tRNA reductase